MERRAANWLDDARSALARKSLQLRRLLMSKLERETRQQTKPISFPAHRFKRGRGAEKKTRQKQRPGNFCPSLIYYARLAETLSETVTDGREMDLPGRKHPS